MPPKGKSAYGEGSLRQKKDGRWEYRVPIPGSRTRMSFYSTDKDGRGAKKKYREWLAKGEGALAVEKAWILKDWAARWLKVKKSNVVYGTYANYERYVNDFIVPAIGDLKLDFVRPYHIEELFAGAAVAKLSDSAKNEIRVCLNGIFNTAVENRLCRANPVKKPGNGEKRPPKPPKFYSLEQAKRLLAYAPTHKWGCYVLACLYTGMRTEELCALCWQEDVTFHGEDSAELWVHRVIAKAEPPAGATLPKDKSGKEKHPRCYELRDLTKGGEDRIVVLNAAGAAFFRSLPREGRFVFSGIKGREYLTPPQLAHRFASVIRDLNRTLPPKDQVPVLSPHKGRHTYGTLLLDGGASIKAVQDQLGHTRITTTQIYLHTDTEMRRQAVAKLPY